ncbi:BrnT family toxin [bacterium]|nr:BrnT family toxin [bacterium]
MEKAHGFAWDPSKASKNIAKHRGVTFQMGMRVSADPKLAFVFSRMEDGEARYLAIGAVQSSTGRKFVLVVVCALRDWPGDESTTTHIISVRPATEKERRLYE